MRISDIGQCESEYGNGLTEEVSVFTLSSDLGRLYLYRKIMMENGQTISYDVCLAQIFVLSRNKEAPLETLCFIVLVEKRR